MFRLEEVVHTSEYVYVASDKQNELCHTSNFQWVRNADVHLVVSGKSLVLCMSLIMAGVALVCSCSVNVCMSAVKNLGPWVRHLIQNAEEVSSLCSEYII